MMSIGTIRLAGGRNVSPIHSQQGYLSAMVMTVDVRLPVAHTVATSAVTSYHERRDRHTGDQPRRHGGFNHG